MTDEEFQKWKDELESDTEEYAGLLSQANYEREKFLLLVRSLLKPSVGLSQLVQSFNLAFALDNAAGDQLDMIGEVVGATRMLNYVPASGDRMMDDDEYRMVLKLTIAQNVWDGTLGSLRKIYSDVFGSSVTVVYVDNQNMTLTISVYGDLSTRETEILDRAGLLLVPLGVGKTVNVVGGSVLVNSVVGVGVTGLEQIETCVAT